MKKVNVLSAILAATLMVTAFAGCGAQMTEDAVVNSEAALIAANPAAKDVKPVPADRDMSGIQGLVVRANSDEVVVSRFYGATVTDVVLTLGAKDPAGVIKELNAAGIKVWVSVNAVKADDEVLAKVQDILAKYTVDGVDLDFLGEGAKEAYTGDTYARIDTVNAFVANVGTKAAEFGKAVAVRVAGDLLTNYNFGLDVAAWVEKGGIAMVSPSSGSGLSDTTLPVRLWYSVLEPYDVVLAPSMGAQVKAYPGAKAAPQTAAGFAGEAAMMLSMGADKVCADYSALDDASIKTLGYYGALLSADRRVLLTYTDFRAGWQASNEQLPRRVSAGGSTVVRIPLGDVAPGSTVMIKIGVSPELPNPLNALSVVANSVPCTANTAEKCVDGYTKTTLYSYIIPAEVTDEGHIVAEINCNNGNFTIDYAELYIDVK